MFASISIVSKILLVSFAFLGFHFTIVNRALLNGKQAVPAINFILQTVGIVGTIYMIFHITY